MPKKQKAPEERKGEGAPIWMISYADMITCCMCLFILLVSMASFSTSKVKEALGSIQGSFGVMAGGGPTESQARQVLRSLGGISVGHLGEIRKFMQRLSSDLIGSSPQMKGIEVNYDPREKGIVIQLPEAILFDPGSAVPRAESYPILREIAYIIIKLGEYDIQVSGHTDTMPSTSDSTWLLGARRAINIVEYLLEIDVDGKMIPQNRIFAATYGSTRPLKDNSSPENRAANRRVDIILREPLKPETDIE